MPLQILSYNKAKDSEQISLHCNILLNEFYYLTVEEANRKLFYPQILQEKSNLWEDPLPNCFCNIISSPKSQKFSPAAGCFNCLKYCLLDNTYLKSHS